MKRALYISLVVNLLAIAAGFWAVQKMGGWGYAWQRLWLRDGGLYEHRKGHFERLPDRPGCVVFLGDSQLAQAEWHEVLGDQPPVLNRGIAGDHVAGVLARLPDVLRHRPSKIFLLVGINDLMFGKPTADIGADYQAIVQKIRSESPQSTLVLLSVLPLNDRVRAWPTSNVEVGALNARIREIARAFALPYLDVGTPLTDADGRLSAKFTQDGLHLNGLGYAVLARQLGGMMNDE
jgi:lysophospholipase L1-like esterase